MSILGAVLRVLPTHLPEITAALAECPGLDIALNPGDGRLVLVIEDTDTQPAAQTFAAISLLPKVLNASLVYEYSGPDVVNASDAFDARYQSWRTTLSQMADGQVLGPTAAPSAP